MMEKVYSRFCGFNEDFFYRVKKKNFIKLNFVNLFYCKLSIILWVKRGEKVDRKKGGGMEEKKLLSSLN